MLRGVKDVKDGLQRRGPHAANKAAALIKQQQASDANGYTPMQRRAQRLPTGRPVFVLSADS